MGKDFWLNKNKMKVRQFSWLSQKNRRDLNFNSFKKRRTRQKGLILIQVDGLSRIQLENAFTKGRLPFLKELIEDDSYQLVSHYSGLPSSTPAVQAELFYGKSTAIPSFCFKDSKTDSIISLLDQDIVIDIQKRLEKTDKHLLSGGTAYSDIFTGGAYKSSYCVAKLVSSWEWVSRISIKGVIILYLLMFFRVAGLIFVELIIAIRDVFKGFFEKRNFLAEVLFIFNRVGICVLLRELVTAGVIVDAARGIPIIHANFVGYDEQAHRRGPSSSFAHWTLKGIDYRIKRIWKSAQKSEWRAYELWIYSDHGQENVIPYEIMKNTSLIESITNVLEDCGIKNFEVSGKPETIQLKRIIFLSSRIFDRIFGNTSKVSLTSKVQVAALGPIGHIYFNYLFESAIIELISSKLNVTASIPMILKKENESTIKVWAKNSFFILPRDCELLFSASHPFYDSLYEDLMNIVNHPDSGDLILLGYNPDKDSDIGNITFPLENGAHGGPGEEETHAFAIVPKKSVSAQFFQGKKYLRPMDLRKAVFQYFVEEVEKKEEFIIHRQGSSTYRFMNYNVHEGIGLDGEDTLFRIVKIINLYQPDVINLQECGDNASRIVHLLNVHHHYGIWNYHKCNATNQVFISRFRFKIQNEERFSEETGEGVVWAEVLCGDRKVEFFGILLSRIKNERQLQLQYLLDEKGWLLKQLKKRVVILSGGFNILPSSASYNKITKIFYDTFVNNMSKSEVFFEKIFNKNQRSTNLDTKNTISEPNFDETGYIDSHTCLGKKKIDHIFISKGIRTIRSWVPHSYLISMCSDHYPLIADIELI